MKSPVSAGFNSLRSIDLVLRLDPANSLQTKQIRVKNTGSRRGPASDCNAKPFRLREDPLKVQPGGRILSSFPPLTLDKEDQNE